MGQVSSGNRLSDHSAIAARKRLRRGGGVAEGVVELLQAIIRGAIQLELIGPRCGDHRRALSHQEAHERLRAPAEAFEDAHFFVGEACSICDPDHTMLGGMHCILGTDLVVVEAARMPFRIVVSSCRRVDGAVVNVPIDMLRGNVGEGVHPGRRLWSLTSARFNTIEHEGDEADGDRYATDSDGEGLEIET